MYNQNNPYQNQYMQQMMAQQMAQQNTLPPQQILTANGYDSIKQIKMAPNSSVLIADETQPIVWKCVSDGLGNVTPTPYDITPHQEPQQISMNSMASLMADLKDGIINMNTFLREIAQQRTCSIADENKMKEMEAKQNEPAPRAKSTGKS